MKKTLTFILLFLSMMVTCMVYMIPMCVIAILAYLCIFLNIHKDLTSTKFVVWFITPITYLEKHLGKHIVYRGNKKPTVHYELVFENENVEQIDFPTIQIWREIICFGHYGQTNRIRMLHNIYKITRTDDGFTITKRKK